MTQDAATVGSLVGGVRSADARINIYRERAVENNSVHVAVNLAKPESSVIAIECAYCCNELDTEEATNPEKDAANNVMCSSCWSNEFQDLCGRCGEMVEKSELKSVPGHLIGVWRDAPGLHCTVAPGYYRVKQWPIFADGMIEGFLYSDNIERISDLDKQGLYAAEVEGCLAGPLCEQCRAKLESGISPKS